ncbi:MFS general substrate transporter [Gloeophyllum trabeum ATCC 11539]|uniref:MFS general substrate transporter n=1 Tax=Gloeophyllum trabeum (strain ATCC 11539 / FP-39264 / Madison 617) TaxID=670483 RepID=S7PXJ7_GLOTA|nr:MFS general substrate transporter [Gloeophyllum trabeum ATCC 11539]EPQ52012.1 MFS general substrate transporter [Gloeophyllum trabeum ATCC 11539]
MTERVHVAPAVLAPGAMGEDVRVEKEKEQSVEQLEIAPDDLVWATREAEDVEPPRSFFGKFLKKNPSPQFLADVQKMNTIVLDPVQVKRIERKVDALIIPALAVCYAFYYIDKTTLSYAAIFGLKKDLKLLASEYSWLSSLFYFGWLGWALPTNMLMQKFPLNKYLAFNIFMWGVLLMCQAASRNFTELAVLRVLSGAFEATADPAFLLITATWYTRGQQPIRIGWWYCANGLGIALGGLLGYAIGHIKGALSSWKYEFLIIGALCSGWSIILFIFVPDSPYTTHWFTRPERLIIVSRKRNDHHGPEHRQWNASQVLEAFIDPKIYLFFLFGFFANVPNGGTSNFGTLITKGFGFGTLETTLMQIPYGFIIVLFILVAMYATQRMPKNTRTILMVLTNIPTVVGFAMVAWAEPKVARLIGYWITGASNATFVVGLSLVSGNVGGQTKKALASAAVFLGVATGNIVGPFLFLDSEAPVYTTGIIGCLVSRALEIVVIIILRILFVTANQRRDRAAVDGNMPAREDLDNEDISDWKNPHFRYVA